MYRVCVHIHMAARISARQARIIFERISDVSDVTSGDETWDSARTLLQVEHFELVEQLIDHGVLEYPEDSLALEFYEKTKALGLEWKNVGATEPCLGRRLNNEALTKALKSKTEALGSKWKAVSSQKPMEGSEITNDALAAKLQLLQLTFTQKEWDEFALPPIGSDDYIRAGRQYFQPALEFTKKEWNAFGVVDLRSDDFIECDGAFFKPASKNSVSAIGPEERAEIDQDFQQELKRLAQEGAGQVENARQDDALAGDPLLVLRVCSESESTRRNSTIEPEPHNAPASKWRPVVRDAQHLLPQPTSAGSRCDVARRSTREQGHGAGERRS